MRLVAVLVSFMAALFTAPAVDAQGQSAPARDARPASSGAASIRGRVVAAATSRPLVGVQVRVEGSGTRFQKSTATDERGEYVLDNLPPGRFAVKASKPGFLDTVYGQRRPREDGTPVELSEGQAVAGVDLILSRGGVIVARITDEFGEPMSGVQLQLERYGFEYGWRMLRPLGGSPLPYLNNRTDDTGQARLYGLPPGDYYVSAFGPVDRMGGGPPVPAIIAAADKNHVYVPTYFPGVMAPETAGRVHVDADRETTISFALVAITRSRITGIVRTSAGAGPYLPELSLVRPNGFSANSRSIHVDPDGSFAAGDLLPGDYLINVTVQAGDSADAPSERAVVPVTLTGPDVTGLIVTTGRGGVLRGRVVYETPHDSKDEGDVQVFLSSVDSPAQDQLRPHEELWDLDGTFEITGLFGRGVVRVTHDADWILKAVMVSGRDVTDQPFDFSDGKPVNGVQVVMTRKSCTVIGSAFDAAGPSREFTTVLFPEDRRQWTPWSRFIASARPDQNGRFRITDLSPGRYLLAAVDDLESGEAFNPDLLARLADAAMLIVVDEGETKDVALTVIKN